MNANCSRTNILLFTPDLTPWGIENGRGITGFSLMVDEYARLLAHYGRVVDVSCSSLQNPDLKIGDEYLLLKRNIWQIVKNARLKDWKYAFWYCLKARDLSRPARLQVFKQRLSTGLYIKQIKRRGTAVAFIQSFLPHIMPFVGASLHTRLPMVVCCHAAYDDKDPLFCNYGGAFARYVICPLVMNGILVCGVSSGIVRYFQRHIPKVFYPQLHVVGNPIPVDSGLERITESNVFTIVVSGNIGERKNQSQVLRALALLPATDQKRLRVVFIGYDSTKGRIQQEAEDLGVNGFCWFAGKLPREKALQLTANADLILSATRSEGFGLPFIEGFTFGIPAVFFADVAAAEELRDPKWAVLVEERSDKALADGILTAMHTEWDRDYIHRSVLKKFSPQVIADKYINVLDAAHVPSMSEKRWDKMMLAYLRNKNGAFYQEK